MFKKKKRWLFLSGLAIMAVVASGCADKDADEPTKDEPTPTEEAATHVEIHGDIINSHTVEDAVCVVNSRFEQGQRLVFRATVNDSSTKELMEDAAVKVVLATGEEFDMELGPHGEEKTLLYTVGWTIPEDFPTGTLDYQYIAELDGETYVYEPFDVSLSKLTILEPTSDSESAEPVIEEEAEEEAA